MAVVEISDETYKRIGYFKKIIDAVIEENMESMNEYAELILKIGMKRMLADVIPRDEMLEATLVAMFEDNPEYLCDFVARVLKKGENEKIKKPRDEWMVAYR